MTTIANPRAEKAARKLAKKLGATITEAVATACERLLSEQDASMLGKRRGEAIARMHAEIGRRGLLEGTPGERARLADHSDLHDERGLPR